MNDQDLRDTHGQCPAATGIPEQGMTCPINETGEHRCMRAATTHPLHTCHCGTQWVSSTDAADQLTQGGPTGPVLGLHWRGPGGSLWIAPIGTPTPTPGHMPAAWVCIRPRTH